MPISGVDGGNPNINQMPAVENSEKSGAEQSVGIDKDGFLKLFMESLKNQDPMSPMETADMMAQLSQLGMMESVSNLNITVKKMEESLLGNHMSQAAGLLDKVVVGFDTEGNQVVGTATAYKLNDGIIEYLVNNKVVQLGAIQEVGLAKANETKSQPEEESGLSLDI